MPHSKFATYSELYQNIEGRPRFDAILNSTTARWVAFISACISSVLALQVALALALFASNGEPNAIADLAIQSREAGVAAVAAVVSVIAQIIAKAAESDKD